jgi:hypothetical protein
MLEFGVPFGVSASGESRYSLKNKLFLASLRFRPWLSIGVRARPLTFLKTRRLPELAALNLFF